MEKRKNIFIKQKPFYKAPPGVSVMLTQDQMSLIIIAVRDYMVRFSKMRMETNQEDLTGLFRELILLHELENIERRFGLKEYQHMAEPSYFSLVQKDGESDEDFRERVGETRLYLEYDPERDN